VGKKKGQKTGYFGIYGGQFVPETLMPALEELQEAFFAARRDKEFNKNFTHLLKTYNGRPTSLYHARGISEWCGGARIYLKREDLNHTGAHKITNSLGQALLAKAVGKTRIIAETGAGQHGVATATAAALLGMECDIYMGTVDMARQRPNVFRMNLLGTRVIPVESGSKTLKDAVNETLRDWTKSVRTTHYVMGSALGPYPFPQIVRHFQSVIGRETRKQILRAEGRLPDEIVACVGGGSNAIGIFSPFLDEKSVRLTGVEAGGLGVRGTRHATRLSPAHGVRHGIFHGMYTYIIQNSDGQISTTHSISAGLDYSGVGPQHALLHDKGRVQYTYATDRQAVRAFQALCEKEGIVPALEPAHALAYAFKEAPKRKKSSIMIVNLSGRGDKDIFHVADYLGKKI
jgi:tryptophan synthase beta chain